MSLYSYWGKARKTLQGTWAFHLLPYHCLDVAAAADAWWSIDAPLRQAMSRACGAEEQHLKAWILFFVALHDLGKWDVRFQLKVPELALALNPGFVDAEAGSYDHGQRGYAAFIREVEDPGRKAEDWMKIVASHHGRPLSDADWQNPIASPKVIESDRLARRSWIDFLSDLFLRSAGADLRDIPPPPSHLGGFCCVCDWVGSNEDFFPYETGTIDLTEYFLSRRANARRALEENGLWRAACATGGMSHLFPELKPRSVQGLVDQWPLRPGLTLIEAPTGSGKTEAALAYASRLLAASLADGVIFALPTQATANAMLARLDAVAPRLFQGGTNVVLAHGRARYNAGFMRLQGRPGPTAQEGEEALAQCASWLASSRKKVFLGQIGVCTIDQVLLSVLPIKHNFVRSFGIHKSILIVDEIHAYDSYMNGLLDEVLKRQRDAGGCAVLLSATLHAVRRGQILRNWAQAPQDAQPGPAPYPLVSRADKTGSSVGITETPEPERKVEVEILPSPGLKASDEVLARVEQAARQGARVAMIFNLVADAQETARRLLALGAPVEVFHSRYRFCDRQDIETRVLERCGKVAGSGRGSVLVATQVIEQSLDLDFDWMVTQLCPADLLFQRLGRLHRHDRPRPAAFPSPRALVLGPVGLGLGNSAYIYKNARAMWRTCRLIERHGEAVFPAGYREWIEAVYAEEAWPDEPPEITAAYEKFDLEQDSKRFAANSLVAPGITYYNDTDGNVTALTRDGEMAANLVPLMRDGGRNSFLDGAAFSELEDYFDERLNMNTVPVPSHWVKELPELAQDRHRCLLMERSSDGNWRARAAGADWTYDPLFGLERRTT